MIALWIGLILLSIGSLVLAIRIAWTTPGQWRRVCPVPKLFLFIIALMLTAIWFLGMLSIGWFVAPFAVLAWSTASVGWRDVRRFSVSGIVSVVALAVLVFAAALLSAFTVRLAASVMRWGAS